MRRPASLSLREAPGLTSHLTQAAALLGLSAALVGVGHLVAWFGGYLTREGLTAITMKTNAALCLALVGVALTLLVLPGVGPIRRWTVRVCAVSALLVGLLTLAENLSGWSLGIDQLLAAEMPGAMAVASPNQMGLPASLSSTLLGLALLILSRQDHRQVRTAQALALAVCLIGLLPSIGFFYGAEQFYGIARYTGIAWPTAVSLLLLGSGLLCARPAEGLMAQVTANDPGGVSLRRLLVPFVILPLLLGWLRLAGERAGVFDAATGTAMMMLLFIILFSALAYHAGRKASRSADAVRESEEKYRTLFNSMDEGFCIIEVLFDATGKAHDYRFLAANPAFEKHTGLANALGRTVRELVPNHEAHWFEVYGRIALSGVPARFEDPAPALGRFYDVYACRIGAPADRRVAVLFSDISERKRTEEALRASEERFRRYFELGLIGMAITSPTKGMVEVNDECCRLLGYERGELLQKTWAELTHPDDLAADVTQFERVLAGQIDRYALDKRFVRKDGRIVDTTISVTAIRSADGAVDYFLALLQDITERKQAQEAIQWSARRDEMLSHTGARLLQSDNPQGLVEELCRQVMDFLDCHAFFNFLVDKPSGRLHLNACAGIPAEEASKIEWLDYGVAVCGCVARDGCRIIAEDIRNTPDPRTTLVKSYGIQAYCCHPLKVQDRLIGTLSFGARSRPRFRPEEIEVMKAVTDLVAMAMHRIEIDKALRELNATLESKVVRRTAELARRAKQLQKLALELSQAEERERRRIAVLLHEDLQQQIAGARFQLNLVRSRARDDRQRADVDKVDAILTETIEQSRSLSYDLSPAVVRMNDLAEVLPWLVERVRTQHGLLVKVDIPDEMMVRSEALAMFLFRAAQEMLFNVAKHAHVRTAALRVRRIGRYVCLCVSDPGCGFDPQELKEACGFGLFSIRERIELLGGRMTIKSAKGQGSRFRLMVPDGREPDARGQKTEDARQKAEGGLPVSVLRPSASEQALRVLLVDDHDIVREGLAALLQDAPDIVVVGEAADGRAAVHMAADLQPDVVVMDVSMPLMSGEEATRQIKTHGPATRVIALSMYEEPDKRETMYRAGAESYVLKTAPSEELLAAIRGRQHVP